MNSYRTSILSIFLLIGSVIGTVDAQESQTVDHELSVLRGTWETHSYRDKFTFTFLSDKKMVYDRRDAEYNVYPLKMRIHSETGDLVYTYNVQNEKLVLTDAFGREMSLNRERFGLYEHDCVGEYFFRYDTSGCEELLIMNDNGAFTYSKQCKVMESDSGANNANDKIVDIYRQNGVYRVEDTFVVLAFDDGRVRQAIVRFRDRDDNVTGIVFNGKIFEKEFVDKFFTYEPTDGYFPPLSPPGYPEPRPPPPPPHPPPLPPPYPDPPFCPPAGGYPTTPSPPPPPERPHRDTGSTRGDSGLGTVDTGSRQRGRPTL